MMPLAPDHFISSYVNYSILHLEIWALGRLDVPGRFKLIQPRKPGKVKQLTSIRLDTMEAVFFLPRIFLGLVAP